MYKAIELFAGAGGLSIGFEQAGIKTLVLVEKDKDAYTTLHKNLHLRMPIEGDVKKININGRIDIVTAGIPCQPFSSAGKRDGLGDIRGTLFQEVVRVVKLTNPKVCIIENVKGLLNNDNGDTLRTIVNAFKKIGYNLHPPKVLNAMNYKVPQSRERLFLIFIRKDIKDNYQYPKPSKKIYTLKDALKRGRLYRTNVPESGGHTYSNYKKSVMELVPEGGNWTNLPRRIQREYMGNSYGKKGMTGMARRLSMDKPTTTLTTSPYEKLTEKCHPSETRPLTIREYARIQTFPDSWEFVGSISSQYKQIGNAVPVNLAKAVGESVVQFLNQIVA